jgi:hypothetical protein
MGGAATVCVQYTDGTRDSFMGYNGDMATIAKSAAVLNASDDCIDKIVKEIVAEQKADNAGSYYESYPGLAPEWYGLNFIDLQKRRIWFCQGQNNIGTYHSTEFYGKASEYNNNVLELARIGFLKCVPREEYIKLDIMQKPKIYSVKDSDLESVSYNRMEDVIKGTDSSQMSSWDIYLICAPNWDHGSFSCIKKMYKLIKQEYNLSDDENKIWKAFIKERFEEDG